MTAMATPRHRIAAAASEMRSTVDAVADASVWSMGVEEAHRTLVELTRLEAQVVALKLRVAGHVAAADYRDASARWAHATAQAPRATRGMVKLAGALDARPRVAEALAGGDVVLEQARVITQALDALPDGISFDLVEKAEAHLLRLAKDHPAPALRILGRRLLEVVAPEEADAHEARLLEREERDAVVACQLHAWHDSHGRLHGRFTLPALQGTMLLRALHAIAAPKHQRAVDGAGAAARTLQRPTPERMGRALCELIERYPTDRLPKAGGVNATVVVTLSYESLIGQLEQAGVVLDTGQRISPAEARRLACQAGIIPAVLGSRSQVLDLGRMRRFHTEAQRIAIMMRDGHCTEPGCDAPPGACHVHHEDPWSAGGPTSVEKGRLLCPRHHVQHHRSTGTKRRFHPRT